MEQNKILSKFPLEKFKEIKEKNPYWSSFGCFIETIKGKNISRMILWENFKKLIDKDDYEKDEQEEIFIYVRKINEAIRP